MEENKSLINRRKRFFTSLGLIGLVILVIYVGVNIYLGDYRVALFEFSLVLILGLALILIKFSKRERLALMLGAIVLFFISVYNFLTGGFDATGIYWLFIFPPIIFAIRGTKLGFYWILALIGTLLIFIFLVLFNYFFLPYSLFVVCMFMVIFFTVSALNFIYQSNQEQYQIIIDKQNKELLKEIEKNKRTLKEIEKNSEYLEKINKLMIGREIKMINLKEQISKTKKNKNA